MSNRGSSLVIAIMAVALLSALGLALALITSTEMTVAASYATGQELTYAAEAGLEIAGQELRLVPDWNVALAGAVQSTWVDGDPARVRILEDGSPLNLSEATNLANCGKTTACSAADMDAIADLRPWGSNNPRWQLFAFGPMNHGYVVAWIGDDAAENDGDPLRDESTATNPGAGVVAVRSEAFGVGGGHKVLEATVRRSGGPMGVNLLSWKEIR
jgi:hypothetical protein